MATFTGQAGTNNTFIGSAVADTFLWATADLNNLDTATGGGGADVLRLTTAGGLLVNALAGISGIPTIQLAAGTNTITLVNANYAGIAGGRIDVFGGSGNDTIDASRLSAPNFVLVTAGAGVDVLTGGAGNDLFRFTAADLNTDTVTGGLGSDRLELSTAGTVTAAALAGVSGVETIALAAGTNSITLGNANVADGTIMRVNGNSGNDTIDAASVSGNRGVSIVAGAGLDTLRGSAGLDTFTFTAADLAGDTVTGGLGSDTLVLSTAGELTAADLLNLTGVELIQLAAGTNTVTLADGNFNGISDGAFVPGTFVPTIFVLGNNGNDRIDGSAVTGPRGLLVSAGGGADTLLGGGGDDQFSFAAANLTSADTVQGGAGLDQITLTTAGAVTLTNVTGIDRINLAAGGNSLTLTDANFTVPIATLRILASEGSSVIDGSGLTGTNSLYVNVSGGADTIIGGAGSDGLDFFFAAPAAGASFDGGGGTDFIAVYRSTSFIGTTIRNVEELTNVGTEAATVTISGESAAGFLVFGGAGLNGVNDIFNIQLTANSVTDLSNLTLADRDVADAIHVINAAGSSITTLSSSIASYTGSAGVDEVYDRGGVQTISLGGDADTVYFQGGNLFAAGDTIDGGAGTDTIRFDQSMDFLGDTITNVENLVFTGASNAAITISGENAARIREISTDNPSRRPVYTVQLSAGSTTDLSGLQFVNSDSLNVLNVVANGGNTAVTLSSSITRFTGSADADTVSLAPTVQYRDQAVIDGGGGDDRIAYDGSVLRFVTIDGGTGNDTLVVTCSAAIDLSIVSSQVSAIAPFTIVRNFENVDASASTAGVTLTGRDNLTSVLTGSSAADVITAGTGGASIIGGLGADVLTGNIGNDRFFFRSTAEAAGDTIDGGGVNGYDSIEVLGETDLTGAAISNIDGLVLGARDEAGSPINASVTATLTGVQATALADVYGNTAIAGTVETLVVNVGEGGGDLSSLVFADWGSEDRVLINGTADDDTITGTEQNDVIAGGTGGFDRLSGAGGDDVIGYDFYLSSPLDGGTGINTVRLDSVNQTITPQLVTVNLAAQTITENTAENTPFTFAVTNFENADFSFAVFAATLIGTNGVNTLIGGSGIDTITGGLGADTLTGGGGADSFVWNDKIEGSDTITDFERGTDKLVFKTPEFGFNGGSFDTAIVVDESLPFQNFGGADLILTTSRIGNATEAQVFVGGLPSGTGGRFFLIGRDDNFNATLY